MSPSMWLSKLRGPKMVTGVLILILFVCLAIVSQNWMSGHIKLTAYRKVELTEKCELTQRSLEKASMPTGIATSIPKNISTRVRTVQHRKAKPENGLYNFTVFTAMMDIGRGAWETLSRPYDKYLSHMEQLLKLEVNMVVYIDAKGASTAQRMRRGKEKHTRIHIISLRDLPYYRYRTRIAEIMASPEYKKDNQLVAHKLPEACIPEYDILVLSKLYFGNKTVSENPFNTSYFIWLDGGYGHGNAIYPKDNLWIPKNLFEFPDKLTIMELDPGVRAFVDKTAILHKLNVAIIAGGFFGGGSDVIKEVYTMQAHLVGEWMRDGIVDDEQTIYVLMYFKKQSLFRLIPGNWYEVFKLFDSKRNITQTT